MSVKTCLIAAHHIQREQWRRDVAVAGYDESPSRSWANSSPHFHVVAPGDMVCAMTFDEVMIAKEVHELVETCDLHKAWFNTCIRARMMRDAEIVVVQ